MRFDIILPDSKPKGFISDAIAEYRKRLSRFCDLRLFYRSANGRQAGRTGHGSGSCVNVLVASGAEGANDFTSEEFAGWIQARLNRSAGGFAFWIPGEGENPKDFGAAWDEVIRLTYIETEWDLAALILTEQIYRAFMINSGSAYHK
ncbi:MAG: 23S rRNA (pseudouridine(1915)-N(3))-methyltransferase RlmH [Defluviitaleaceae bacterium]|nr:23S rRNA (pseudouridine(1915)-N(3))-methyltransferase RlmH [Defluviitaleaceae bacterium]